MHDKLKNFIVFAGWRYYPEGGFNDVHNSYDTLEEALAEVRRFTTERNDVDNDYGDWWHVYSVSHNAVLVTSDDNALG